MTTVLIVIHLMVVLAMIALVLLQRSEGGALGIGGGGGMMTGRGAGNLLTRFTAVLAAAFFLTSIGLTVLARLDSGTGDIFERLQSEPPVATEPAETGETPPIAPPAPDGGSGPGVLDALRNPRTSAQPIQPSAPSPQPVAPQVQTPTPPTPTAPTPTAPGPQAPPAEGGTQ
ncbi:preprotein translocase subunit SecG [Afifella pfennigii]|uniref:preprotein translocase subunit SecG n=1 Tax=Afifella pfennigii TaxID=209897 RepID=UPI000554D9BF|nr:preprotein translocase subunit SecG [Afifella pfennigii]